MALPVLTRSMYSSRLLWRLHVQPGPQFGGPKQAIEILGKLIVSRYIAESMEIDCRAFWLHRSLSTAYKTVLHAVDKGLWAETSCNQ